MWKSQELTWTLKGLRSEEYKVKVKVANRTYRMSRKEYQGLLEIARDQVPMGIYALEKNDYAELRNDRCKSITQLKALTRQFKAQGFKVMANGK